MADIEAAASRPSIECIATLADIDRIGEEWHALEARAADPLAYFQSFDWCRNWCAHYAGGDSGRQPAIRVYAGYQDGRLVMLWPMMVASGRLGVRKLVALTEPHCQYGNVLLDPSLSADAAAALIAEGWRTIRFLEKVDAVIFEGVPAATLPGSAVPRGLRVRPAGHGSALDLTRFAGYEAYRAALNPKTRRARNKRRNRLAALGRLDYRVHFGGTPDYAELVATGVEMKRAWLEKTGRATRALNLPLVPDFLGALAGPPGNGNGAMAAALLLDGRSIAVEIGFLYHRRFYSYLGAFDWALRSYSPGKLQLEEAIRWCLEHGVETYDLLGEPSTYKDDWSNVTMRLATYRAATTFRGRLYLHLWTDLLRPVLKRCFEAAPLSLRRRLRPVAEKVEGSNPVDAGAAFSWLAIGRPAEPDRAR